jgi:hypothetical protein
MLWLASFWDARSDSFGGTVGANRRRGLPGWSIAGSGVDASGAGGQAGVDAR